MQLAAVRLRPRAHALPARKGRRPPFDSRFLFDASELLEFSPIFVDGVALRDEQERDVLRRRRRQRQGAVEARPGSSARPRRPTERQALHHHARARPRASRARGNGKRVWTRTLPGALGVLAARQNGKVYFGAESGDLYAVEAENGTTSGTSTPRARSRPAPAYHNGTVYVGDYAGHMYAVQRQDGAIAGTRPTSASGSAARGRFYATPAVAFGRVYAGNADGACTASRQSSGDIAWTHSTGDLVYASPAVADTPTRRRASTSAPPTTTSSRSTPTAATRSGRRRRRLHQRLGERDRRHRLRLGLRQPEDVRLGRSTTATSSTRSTRAVQPRDLGRPPDLPDRYAGITKLTPKQEGAGPGKGGAEEEPAKAQGRRQEEPSTRAAADITAAAVRQGPQEAQQAPPQAARWRRDELMQRPLGRRWLRAASSR